MSNSEHENWVRVEQSYLVGLQDEVNPLRAQLAEAQQKLAGNVGDGWQLVPKEPTNAMIAAAFKGVVEGQCVQTQVYARKQMAQKYKAMLTASPQPSDVGQWLSAHDITDAGWYWRADTAEYVYIEKADIAVFHSTYPEHISHYEPTLLLNGMTLRDDWGGPFYPTTPPTSQSGNN